MPLANPSSSSVTSGAITTALGYTPATAAQGATADAALPASGLSAALAALGSASITGSANTITLAGSATGSPITLTATGSDTNIDVSIFPKGPEGQFNIGSVAGMAAFNASSGFGATYQQEGTYASLRLRSATTDGSGGSFYEGYAHRGTLAVPLACHTDDILNQYTVLGHDGADFVFGGLINVSAAENWEVGKTGTKVSFESVKIGTGSDVQYLYFDGLQTFLGGTEPTTITGSATIASFLQGQEISEPAAPAANGWRLFAKDTGGKTALMVRFPSGASQQLAIEP